VKPLAHGAVLLDGDWLCHLDGCLQCRGFDVTKPATAVALCLEGAILWKRDHAKPKRKALPGERDPHRVSAAEAKRTMRHKED
jgi:hypothetical protein